MSTLKINISAQDVDQRFARMLMKAQGSYEVGNKLSNTRHSLASGQNVTVNWSTICVAYFSKPTVIQLTIEGSTSTVTVEGTIVLSFPGSVYVAHPGGGVTDPTEVEFLTS